MPKHRGPVEYLATLVCKALRKHGWPAGWRAGVMPDVFVITDDLGGAYLAQDFLDAIAVCCRIVARTYRIDVTEDCALITLNRRYLVTEFGKFREVTE